MPNELPNELPTVEPPEPYTLEQVNMALAMATDPRAQKIEALSKSKVGALMVTMAADLVRKGSITLLQALTIMQAQSMRAGVLLAVIDAAGVDALAAAMSASVPEVSRAEVAQAFAAEKLATKVVQ